MRKRLLAAGSTAVLLLLAACSGGAGSGSATTGAAAGGSDTLTLGDVSYPASWDVNGLSIAHYVDYFDAVYDTLIRQDGTGKLVPGLATDWSYDSARTTLTLTVRSGIKFTDGTDFNADAVVANVKAFKASSTPDLSNAQYISGVTAPDATHVVFTLSAPDPMLTRWLTGSLGFMESPKQLTAADAKTNPVGTGPYTLDTAKTVVGSKYVFEKNPSYWDTSYHVYKTLTINYYESPTALLNAVQGGQLDASAFSDFSSLPQVQKAGYTVNKSQLDWSGLIFYDRDGKQDAALGNVKVRQAINYAIDRAGILKAIEGGNGTVTSSVFGKATAGYDASLDSYYTYDPAKAKQLLSDAGYPNGFTLTMPSASLINQSLLTTIQQELGAVGITVKYTDVGSNFITDLLGGKFTSSWMQLASANDWQFAQLALVPKATFNPFHTESPEADKLFATMQSGSDADAAAAAKSLNTYMTENAWFAPFFRIDNLFLSKPGTKVTMAADNTTPYLYLIQPAS